MIARGRVDKRVRMDVLEVVTRGAEPGERACDGCRRKGRELRECRVPYSTEGGGRTKVYWRDFCSDCITRVCAAPALPFGAGKEKLDAAWENLMRRLRQSGAEAPAAGQIPPPAPDETDGP